MGNTSGLMMFEYNGEWHPIAYYAKLIGCNPQRLRDFLRYGYSLEDAMARAKKPPIHRRLTYNGEEKSISEWSKISGVAKQTITDRIDKGMPPEMCLYNGNLNTYKKELGYGTYNAEKMGRVPQSYKERAVWEKQITDDLKRRSGTQTEFRVRWCDRTSHSHSWRETEVGLYDLDAFLDSHYLARVVVGW